jgi:hypothetical protein
MVSGSVNVKVTGERCADAKREQCGVDDVGDELFHGCSKLLVVLFADVVFVDFGVISGKDGLSGKQRLAQCVVHAYSVALFGNNEMVADGLHSNHAITVSAVKAVEELPHNAAYVGVVVVELDVAVGVPTARLLSVEITVGCGDCVEVHSVAPLEKMRSRIFCPHLSAGE